MRLGQVIEATSSVYHGGYNSTGLCLFVKPAIFFPKKNKVNKM